MTPTTVKRGANMIDISGQDSHGCKVIGPATSAVADGAALWNVLCQCGNEFVATGPALRKGDKKSCGCNSKTRGSGDTSRSRWLIEESDGATFLLRRVGSSEVAVVEHDGVRWVCSECGPQRLRQTATGQCGHVQVVGRNLPASLAVILASRIAKPERRALPGAEKVMLKTQIEISAAGEAKRAERAREHDEGFVAATPVVVRQATAEDLAKLEAARARRRRTLPEPQRSAGFGG